MLQCAPYIKNLCQNLNNSFTASSDQNPNSGEPFANSPVSSTVKVADQATNVPCVNTFVELNGSSVRERNGGVCAVKGGGTPTSVIRCGPPQVRNGTAGGAGPNHHMVATCLNVDGSGSVKHVVTSRGAAVPLVHETKSSNYLCGTLERRTNLSSFGVAPTALGSLPNLESINKDAIFSDIKLRSGSFTESSSRGPSVTSKNIPLVESNSLPCGAIKSVENVEETASLPRFSGSTFVATHSGVLSKKLVSYNSLTRPHNKSLIVSVSPVTNSAVSSNSSSAISLSEISEDVAPPPPQSSNHTDVYYNVNSSTSFCTSLSTSTTSCSVGFLNSGASRHPPPPDCVPQNPPVQYQTIALTPKRANNTPHQQLREVNAECLTQRWVS